MKNKTIRFSVLIPTRNRLELLKYAVESILSQSYENWELIITDNNSEDDIEGYIRNVSDDRIVYKRHSTTISVTDNWNSANDLANGDYILMLGDDDALVPNALSILAKTVDEYNPQIISFRSYIYTQPGVDPDEVKGNVSINMPFYIGDYGNSQLLTTGWRRKLISNCYNFETYISFNMQYYCYSHEAVGILQQYGHFFEPPYPDYYATSMCMWLLDSFVYIPEVLSVIGVTKKSYGFYYKNDNEKEGMKFHKEENFRQNARKEIQNLLCTIDEMDTAAYVTFDLVCQRLNVNLLSLIGYYKSVIRRLQKNQNQNNVVSVIRNEMIPNIDEIESKSLLDFTNNLYSIKKNVSDYIKQQSLTYNSISAFIGDIESVREKLNRAFIIAYYGNFPDLYNWLNKIGYRNIEKRANGRKIRVWGCYPRGKYISYMLKKHNLFVCGFIEKKNYFIEDVGRTVDIIKPEEAVLRRDTEFIIIPTINVHDEMIILLSKYGYVFGTDYICFFKE